MFKPFYAKYRNEKYLVIGLGNTSRWYHVINLSTKEVDFIHPLDREFLKFLGFADDADLQAMTIKEPQC